MLFFLKKTTVNQALRNESPSGAIMSVENQPQQMIGAPAGRICEG